jgi:hypothetical protein
VAAQQPQSSSAIDAELKKDRFGSQGGVGVQGNILTQSVKLYSFAMNAE